jgi:hypothetical protein
LFYALAVVALLAGLTVPASAQGVINCVNNGSVNAPVRAQGYADLVGDIYLSCSGGTPTVAGQPVPPVNIQVSLNTNITSKLVSSTGLFNEALLIIDDPNTPGTNSNRPILNCGAPGAPDNGVSGPGVCEIVSTGVPANTYDGTAGSSTYGTGRPNVFQGRQGTPQNTGQASSIYFLGVPLDPPGTNATRTLRVTNIRADAEYFGIVSGFVQQSIFATIIISGNNLLTVATPVLTVGTVQNGLIVSALNTRLNFIQCNSENAALAGGKAFAPGGSTCGGASGGGCNGFTGSAGSFGIFSGTPIVRLMEGFASAWKVKNVAMTLANSTFGSPVPASYNYNGSTTYPSDLNQNVPGVNYNTESGFEFISLAANPSGSSTPPSPFGNPPAGFGAGTPVTGATQPFADANGTGIAAAGVATQGTRLALSFGNIPQGSNVWVPPVIYLYRQNSASIPVPSTFTSGVNTGVAVLTTTDANGNTAFSAATTTGNLQQVSSSNLAVYEVLMDDPSSLEQVDIPVVVSYVANLSANPPGGLPVAGPTSTATVAGGFAPFYTGTQAAAAKLPSATLPVPRFIPGTTPLNIFAINKCACNLLFPFVSNVLGYDTGLAIANTTSDPGASYGFNSTGPQQGAVTLWFYGQGANGTAPPASFTSATVPSGQLMTYVLSSGNSGASAGFQGYIIAQAQFQYCHGYAFLTSQGALPTSSGVSEGYLGIVLDNYWTGGELPRTTQAAENDAH